MTIGWDDVQINLTAIDPCAEGPRRAQRRPHVRERGPCAATPACDVQMITRTVVRPYRKTDQWEADVTMLHNGQKLRRRWRSPLPSRQGTERWARERARCFLAELGSSDAPTRREEPSVSPGFARLLGPVTPGTPTFAEFAERFMNDHVLAEQLALPTVLVYRKTLGKHLVPFFGNFRLDEIDPALVQQFKRSRESLSKPWLNKLIDHLKTVLHKAEQWKVLKAVPRIPRLKEERRERAHYGPEDAEMFTELCRRHAPRTYVAALLGIDAGLRHSEVLGLRWEDIRLDEGKYGCAVIANRRWNGVDGPPKHGKHRRVPLSLRLRDALLVLKRVSPSRYVILTHWGKPVDSHATIPRWFAEACDVDGVPRGVHILRHTFATDALRSGVNLRILQKLLGHSSIAITERYLHTTSAELDDAVLTITRARTQRSWRNAGEDGIAP